MKINGVGLWRTIQLGEDGLIDETGDTVGLDIFLDEYKRSAWSVIKEGVKTDTVSLSE